MTRDELINSIKNYQGEDDKEVWIVVQDTPNSLTAYDIKEIETYPHRIEIIINPINDNLTTRHFFKRLDF